MTSGLKRHQLIIRLQLLSWKFLNHISFVTWCEEPTHWKRLWRWERLRAGGEGDDRGWDGWMASPTQWTWVWANSGRQWRRGKPGVLQSLGSQRVRHDSNWITTKLYCKQWQCPLCEETAFLKSRNKLKILTSFLLRLFWKLNMWSWLLLQGLSFPWAFVQLIPAVVIVMWVPVCVRAHVCAHSVVFGVVSTVSLPCWTRDLACLFFCLVTVP